MVAPFVESHYSVFMGGAFINFNHVQFGNDFHNVLTYFGR